MGRVQRAKVVDELLFVRRAQECAEQNEVGHTARDRVDGGILRIDERQLAVDVPSYGGLQRFGLPSVGLYREHTSRSGWKSGGIRPALHPRLYTDQIRFRHGPLCLEVF